MDRFLLIVSTTRGRGGDKAHFFVVNLLVKALFVGMKLS